jgi:ABC-type molybdenum transport system ATPase subunit/photorepair protein PhrA
MLSNLITKIRIENLFGMYTYTIPKSNLFSNAPILYADNGAGKSTILNLTFHLLSAAHNRGHRGALFKSNFTKLEVDLNSGIRLVAEKKLETDTQFLNLSIFKNNKVLAIWEYSPKNERKEFSNFEYLLEREYFEKEYLKRKSKQIKNEKSEIPRGEKAYLDALSEYAPTIFMLNADRRLDSDSVPDPSDEVELRKLMHYDEPKRIHDLVVRSREIALTQAMNSASKWLSKKAVLSSNQGNTNVHSIYINIVSHLSSSFFKTTTGDSSVELNNLLTKLEVIREKSEDFAKFELTSKLSIDEFKSALSSNLNINLAIDLLKPYIESLESRFNAMNPIYKVINIFVTKINDFLHDKYIDFKLTQGFSLRNINNEILDSSKLSSGEQQLILLFCYVLTARDKPSIFIIDEPEISLNIKWQRKLLQSLLDITKESNIQFLFASHSIELISQHSEHVIKMVNENVRIT